jgi:hypothetical protein
MKPWRGRVRRQLERAFMTHAGQDLSTSILGRWIWPRRSRFETWHYNYAKPFVREIADPIARGPGRGRPWLWRLRKPENDG